jgi:hypothetical protein
VRTTLINPVTATPGPLPTVIQHLLGLSAARKAISAWLTAVDKAVDGGLGQRVRYMIVSMKEHTVEKHSQKVYILGAF